MNTMKVKVYGNRNSTLKKTCVSVTDENVIDEISGSINEGSGSVVSRLNNNVSIIENSNLSNINEIENTNNINHESEAPNKNIPESNLLKPEIPKIVNKNFPKLVGIFDSLLKFQT